MALLKEGRTIAATDLKKICGWVHAFQVRLERGGGREREEERKRGREREGERRTRVGETYARTEERRARVGETYARTGERRMLRYMI